MNDDYTNEVICITVPLLTKIFVFVFAAIFLGGAIYLVFSRHIVLFGGIFLIAMVSFCIGIYKVKLTFSNSGTVVVEKSFVIPFFTKCFNLKTARLHVQENRGYAGESSALFYKLIIDDGINKGVIINLSEKQTLVYRDRIQKHIDKCQ